MIPSLTAAVLWGLAACGLCLVPPPRRVGAGWALVGIGVPLLGWLTWRHGPLIGAAALCLGVATLFWAPKLRRPRAR